jgi:DNA repair and recombination protein RAD52
MESKSSTELKKNVNFENYSIPEMVEIQSRLDCKLEPDHLSYRPAAQGTVAYLEGWKAINLANECFGFNGWSSEILNFSTDFVISFIFK